MKSISTLLFAILFSNCLGQQHFKGFSVGLSHARTERPNYSYYKPVNGLVFDAFYEYRKNHFISKSAIGFQQKGFAQELIFVDTNNNILGAGAIEKTRFSYAGLSQWIGLEYGDEVFGYACIGLSASYYLFTKVQSEDFTLDNGQISAGYSTSFQNLKPFDIAASAEIGFGFKLKNRSTLILMSSYNPGLVKIRYKDVATENPWRNNFFSFKIGFRYPLRFSIDTNIVHGDSNQG